MQQSQQVYSDKRELAVNNFLLVAVVVVYVLILGRIGASWLIHQEYAFWGAAWRALVVTWLTQIPMFVLLYIRPYQYKED
jgi:hypothetical protein